MAPDPRPPNPIEDATTPELREQPMKPGTYAWLAGGGLLVSIGLLLFLVFQADLIVASGLDHRVFYVLLVPLGLAAGAFAYGAMASTGGFSGNVGPGEVKLTGPAVFAGLVVVGGFFLVPEGGAVTLVVRVLAGGASGVPGAEVVVDAGQARSTATTDAGGQVVFAGLGREAVASGLSVAVTASGYEPARFAEVLPVNGVVEVTMTALPLVVTGTVLERESRRPVADVILDFGSGEATDTTDAMGNFRVELERTGGEVTVLGLRGDTVGLNAFLSRDIGQPQTLYWR